MDVRPQRPSERRTREQLEREELTGLNCQITRTMQTRVKRAALEKGVPLRKYVEDALLAALTRDEAMQK